MMEMMTLTAIATTTETSKNTNKKKEKMLVDPIMNAKGRIVFPKGIQPF
jgi:pyridoxal/pyridoxine/pyridoxamine kinase